MLATIDAVEFLYTCPGHLADRGFAARLGVNETNSVGVTEEEVAKVKEEWEEKQKQKERKEKEKAKEGEKDKDKSRKDEAKGGEKDKEKEPSKSPNIPATSAPAHERYALHRDYFAS